MPPGTRTPAGTMARQYMIRIPACCHLMINYPRRDHDDEACGSFTANTHGENRCREGYAFTVNVLCTDTHVNPYLTRIRKRRVIRMRSCAVLTQAFTCTTYRHVRLDMHMSSSAMTILNTYFHLHSCVIRACWVRA